MRTLPRDPRHAAEDDDQPVYRVDFVTHGRPSGDVHRVFEARDVLEVQGWAQRRAAGRDYVICVEYPGVHGTGLARVLSSRC
ncbi:hypothetical protein [Cellulomonas sp. C5510]|uniref:hypothetical protein n=1 Tax=Cellulomonas sp. C5510 TaxID=2871170 RepID=UPI001C97ADEF|nr:hypothetical protein [Cellulomonas sp. C5510]QZN86985.1 hypothetical protein K5O09_07715 [Cellulomonas sp. C5510]